MNKLGDHALSFNISLKKRKFSGTQVQYSMSYEGLIPQQHYQNFQRENEIFSLQYKITQNIRKCKDISPLRICIAFDYVRKLYLVINCIFENVSAIFQFQH